MLPAHDINIGMWIDGSNVDVYHCGIGGLYQLGHLLAQNGHSIGNMAAAQIINLFDK